MLFKVDLPKITSKIYLQKNNWDFFGYWFIPLMSSSSGIRKVSF